MSTVAPQQQPSDLAVNRRAAQLGLIALATVIVLCFVLLIAGARGAQAFDGGRTEAHRSVGAVTLNDANDR